MRKVDLRMNEQEKYEVIKGLVDTNGNKQRAALTLGVTIRSVNRMINIYKLKGKAGFIHGNRGRLPRHTRTDDQKETIIGFYKGPYFDFNYRHFKDMLEGRESISISYQSLYQLLTQAGYLSPKAQRKTIKKQQAHLKQKQENHDRLTEVEQQLIVEKNILEPHLSHARVPRSKYFGELLQMDASNHVWFGEDKAHLHIAIDDATNIIVGAYFDYQETLNGYYNVLWQVLKNDGIPYGILTDNRTVFIYRNEKDPTPDLDTLTQFGYACATLGIKLDTTSVPQKKGRVERAFGTLQSRLVNELHLDGIKTIEQANQYLEKFIIRHNNQFALHPNHIQSVFEKQIDDETILKTLVTIVERTFDKGSSISYKNTYYQAYDQRGSLVNFAAKTKCRVMKNLNDELHACVNDRYYLLLPLESHYHHSKELDSPEAKVLKPVNTYRPPAHHPWKEASYLRYQKRAQKNSPT